ncbi:sugar ABC transporter permease [Clostridium bowmanii]|uniref:carbohydrate ABC transporter permease n=1 Tax=Clostridium bowmanii TaxID=132925 RepID=UPI001C0D1724|nr:sugar ABC transporter permease [Clostridium bowmanii]MBU3188032.1 sugar ABC transporter permease [Clostridium bowmanii]MCA1072211.1 sugar ABC transporter permease [Clostridium bowmanii]
MFSAKTPTENESIRLKKAPKKFITNRTREKLDGWLFIAPFVISALVFLIGPLIVAFILSFKEYALLDRTSFLSAKNVGFDNYLRVFKDPIFLKSLKNTFIYSLCAVPLQLVIALLLAMVVDSKIKAKTFFRVAYYIPTLTSAVAVSLIFLFLFKVDGLFNKFISIFGIVPKNWFTEPKFALGAIVLMAVWSSVGVYMIIFLSGLQEIPQTLYEAAEIDGANKLQRFFKITLPLIKPTFFFNLVVSVIGTLQMFDQSYIISGGNGGPLDSTMTMVLYLYNKAFKESEMGYASAIAFVIFAILFTLTIIEKKIFKEEEAN